jgi:hypothetical protein
MEIKTKLTESDYVSLNLKLLFRKPLIRFLMVIAVVALVMAVINLFAPIDGLTGSIWTMPVLVFVFLPTFTYFTAKKNFATNVRLRETMQYKFEPQGFDIIGESFSSSQTWGKVYKVTKLKQWILIWQSPQMANLIPRRDLWEGDIAFLKEMLDRHHVQHNI